MPDNLDAKREAERRVHAYRQAKLQAELDKLRGQQRMVERLVASRADNIRRGGAVITRQP